KVFRMIRGLYVFFFLMGFLNFFSGPVLAHHSVPTNYDMGDVSKLIGIVKEVDIRNPHSLVILDVTNPDGTVIEWLIEWNDGNALRRRGVPIDKVRIGDTVTMNVLSHRRVEHVAYLRDVLVPDGTIVRDCGAGIYRGAEYYATCEDAENSASDN
ncbi:MAG: DUF6152 family protein, partial [Gammaproteobacteria bacterium]